MALHSTRGAPNPAPLGTQGSTLGRATATAQSLRLCRPEPGIPYPPREVLVFQVANPQAATGVLAPHEQLTFVCKGRARRGDPAEHIH